MRPKSPRKTLKLYIQALRPFRGRAALHLLFVGLAVFLQSIAVPYMLAQGIKLLPEYLATSGVSFWSFFGFVVTLYSLSQFGGWLFWRLSGAMLVFLTAGVVRNLERQVFEHLSTLSYRFFASSFSGALVAQANRFVGSFERLYDSFAFDIMPLIIKIGFSFSIIFMFAPGIAVALLAFCVIFTTLMIWLFIKKMPASAAAAAAHTRLTARLADNITNISAIKYFASESTEIRRYHDITQELYRKIFRDWSLQEYIHAFQAFVMIGFEVGAFIVSLQLMANRTIDMAQFILIQAYIWNIFGSLWNVGRIARNIERSLADATEMTEILHTKPDVVNAPGAKPVSITQGAVSFDGVNFSYHEGKKPVPVFAGLDLDVAPGEKVGLVGTSGGGKTTITKLLLRLMDIDGGAIRLDGHNIAEMRQADVRRAISYVPQEPLLFHRTLRENIAYGRPGATLAEIKRVASRAHAAEFIDRLSDGYDTLVGERGIKLSGGQRQRVAIARAMLKDAPILMLDEATSALDSESEKLIQKALWSLMEGRTAIVIAHRLSTIQRLDRIIVLDRGHIAEQGTHAQLLAAGGIYAGLWSHQSGGFLED
jgi:ATP-binding cassette subfamily B protein